MKTVTVIEGFAGGPLHTRQFRNALTQAGFKVIKNRQEADIIIAHSAGIYGIPQTSSAKLLILIGPTYWPGRRLIKRVIRHTQTSRRYHVSNFGWRYYIWKKILEFYYFFRRHSYMWLGIIHNNRLEHLNRLIRQPGRKTLIIRNQDDPFSGPGLEQAIKGSNLSFVELPGVHDDYVTNPKPYIDLLLKEI
jgi:hypothetical protein